MYERVLRELYLLKWLGHEYMDQLPLETQESPSLPDNLESLKEIVSTCHLCDLAKSRKNVVFGEGDPQARLMFVGEGPGATEDETGRPFVGRAGQLLTKMIESVLQIPRSKVYIANIVKCRPPNNRVPTPQEAESCLPYLLKQIEIVDPKIIVALGATSYRWLTGDKTPISRIRGHKLPFKGRILVPTFHPSYLLRNPSKKREAYQDLLLIKELLWEE